MNTTHILDLLFEERKKLENCIAALQGEPHPNPVPMLAAPGQITTKQVLEMPHRKGGGMSEAGKERLRAALRKRHAEMKREKAAITARMAKARAAKGKKKAA